jgi:hypothetical protein
MPLTLNEAIEVVTKGYPVQYENNVENQCSFCEQSKSSLFFVYNNKEVCKSCSIIVNDLKEKINSPIPNENVNKNEIQKTTNSVMRPSNQNELEELKSYNNIINPNIGLSNDINKFFGPLYGDPNTELDQYFSVTHNNHQNLFE